MFKFKVQFELIAFKGQDKIDLGTFDEYPNQKEISESLEKYLDENEDVHFSDLLIGVNKVHIPKLNY